MSQTNPPRGGDRRAFLRTLAGGIGGAALAGLSGRPAVAGAASLLHAPFAAGLVDRIGLQLFTVRDRTAKDYPGTLLQVGTIGFKEVQTTGSYGAYSAPRMKELLDAAGVVAPTTHVSPVMGPEMEATLEGYRLIGHRYTTVSFGPRGGGGANRAPGSAAATPAAAASAATAPRAPRAPAPPQTLESVKRTAGRLNEAGKITQKFGIKVIVHNHTNEFSPLADSAQLPYDVLLAETDPALVAMELDIGWAAVAGQSAVELFRKAPGRFEVWHVKDVAGLSSLAGLATQAERQRAARIVPLGEGELDYRPIFAQAQLAGMKHFYVEQDSAPDSGDSLAAAAVSYRNLVKVLT